MIICPCKDCENRNVGCHAFCSDYRFFRNQMDERNSKIRKENERGNDEIGTYFKMRKFTR